MKNFLAQNNLFAVSAGLKEPALNTEQTLDTSMLLNLSNIPMALDRRSEDNSNEANGKEEPDTIYRFGATGSGSFSVERAQAQHFAFLLSFGLGASTPAVWGTGYKHTITPLASIYNPFFTSALRLGNTIMKRRFASNFVDTIKAAFGKDSWAKIEAGLKATGKYADNMYKETVNAAYNATSLALAANAVQGGDAATRLDNVHRIRVKVPTTNEWKEVTYSVVSGATPAVITIAAPGGVATLCDYEILYVPAEAAWCTFPARVTEPPLRVSDLLIKIGGKWDGTTFNGGRTLDAEVESMEYNLNNQIKIEFRPDPTGATSGEYANYAMREGRIQTIALNREARDFILEQMMIDEEYSGVYIKATGAEFETGKNYFVEGIFPRCAVLKAPLSINGKVVAQAGDIRILEDDTYGSCKWIVANKVSGYAQ